MIKPTKERALKAELIIAIAFLMGVVFFAGSFGSQYFIDCSRLSLICSYSYASPFLTFEAGTILSAITGVLSLHYFAKTSWLTSFAAPLISFAYMFAYLLIGLTLYRRNFIGIPFWIGPGLFMALLVYMSFFLERFRKWTKLGIALVIFEAPLLALFLFITKLTNS